MLAVWTLHGLFELVDLRSGKVQQPRSTPPLSRAGSLGCAAFSPDGTTLATGHGNAEVRFWDTGSIRSRKVIDANREDGEVSWVGWSEDGAVVGVASNSRVVKFYDAKSGALLAVLPGQGAPPKPGNGVNGPSWALRSVALAPDGTRVVTASNDRTAQVWNLPSRTVRHVLKHPRAVTAVVYHPAGRLFVTGCADGRLRVWESETGRLRGTFRLAVARPDDQPTIHNLAFNKDGSRLACSAGDRTEVWDLARAVSLQPGDLQPVQRKPLAVQAKGVIRVPYGTPGTLVLALAVSGDGREVAAVGGDNVARIFEAGTLKPVSAAAHPNLIHFVVLSADGSTLASGTPQSIRVSEVRSGKVLATFSLDGRPGADALALSPDGKTLAAGLKAGGEFPALVKLWDVPGQKELRSFRANAEGIQALTFSSEGRTLATGSVRDPLIRLWDVATGRPGFRLRGHAVGVRALAFAPDGKTLVSSGMDQTIRIWHVEKGRQLFSLDGHTRPVTRLAFSADGKTLATGGEDLTVRLWDTPSGKLLYSLLQGSAVNGLAFVRDEALLLGSRDGSIVRQELKVLPRLGKRPAPVTPDLERSPAPEVPVFAQVGRVTPFTAAAFGSGHQLFLGTRDRFLLHYTSPDLPPKGVYWTGAHLARAVLDERKGLLYAVAIDPRESPDGIPGTGLKLHDLHVYDVKPILEGKSTGYLLSPLAVLPLRGILSDLILAPDGSRLYSLDVRPGGGPTLRRVDLATRQKDGELRLELNTSILRAAPDGKTLYALASRQQFGKSPALIQVIDPDKLAVSRVLEVDVSLPADLLVGQGVAFVSRGGVPPVDVAVLDLEAVKPSVLARWPGASGDSRLHLAPDGKRLYVVSQTPTRRIETFEVPGKIGPAGPIAQEILVEFDPLTLKGSSALSPDGRFLVSSGGLMLRLGPEAGPPGAGAEQARPKPGAVPQRDPFTLASGRVLSLTWSRDGKSLLVGSDDQWATILDATRGVVQRRDHLPAPVYAVAWSPNDRTWVAAGWHGGGQVHSLPGHNLLARWPRCLGLGVDGLGYTPDGSQVIAAGEKGLVAWPTTSAPNIREVAVNKPLTAVAVQPGTGVVAVGCVDGTIRRFEPSLEKEKPPLKGHTGEVRCLAFSPNGKKLLSGGIDRTVRVYDAGTEKELRVLKGHEHVVLAVAWARDGRTGASASADGVIRLWNAETGKELAVLPSKPGTIASALAFSPDGQTLAGGGDREVRRWDVSGLVGKIEGGGK
jgi:WD40 repeat protein